MMFGRMFDIARAKGDPRIVRTGPSSLTASDRMARNLGWFSLGLGAIELFAPKRVTQALGMEGDEGLIRAYGLREVAAGVLSLSTDKEVGLWSRVAGDGLDMATLVGAMHYHNPKKGNVALAMLVVGGITLLDLATAQQVSARHTSNKRRPRLYDNRTGYPKGLGASRGIARRKNAAAGLG
ncbi:hypothetical protein [Tardiphaga sp.]|jgi:hypothetical protein|uniref:hypothetical protein n=1 Tax=Tardiphaga sp. TaxID=1926292 RepID=UPI0037DA27EC